MDGCKYSRFGHQHIVQLYHLGEITGEVTNEDKLIFIFSKFQYRKVKKVSYNFSGNKSFNLLTFIEHIYYLQQPSKKYLSLKELIYQKN
jgi:hypothetical protein